MAKRPYNFEDVDESVNQIRNLVQIYGELMDDPLCGRFPADYVQERIDLYRSIMLAVMAELRDLSDGVKAALKIEWQECERKAVPQ